MIPTIDRIDHIHVYVTDRTASERWYADVMGFVRVPELERWAADGPLTLQNSSGTVHIGGTAFLGLQIDGSGAGAFGDGLLVAGTVNGSGAADAGIVAGDVVTAVDGRAVATQDALKSVLDGKKPGDTVHLRWTDQMGVSQAAKVTLTDGPTG